MTEPTESVSETKVRQMLALAIASAGSLRAFARKHKLSAAYVSDVQLGQRPIGPKIAAALGLQVHVRRVVTRTFTRPVAHRPVRDSSYSFGGVTRLNPFAR